MQGVYFIHAPELEQASLFKIGWSKDVHRRLSQFQTGSLVNLEVYAVILTNDKKIEKRIHKAMFKYRTRGEWFEITTSQVDVICAIINEFVELDDENEEWVPSVESNEDLHESIDSKDNIVSDNETDEEYLQEDSVESSTEEVEVVKKVVKKPKPFVCKKCRKGFEKRHHLEKHINKKNACDQKHQCSECKKTFPNSSELKRHENRVTSCAPGSVPVTTNKENKCHLCGNEYSSPYSLNRHLKTCSVTKNQLLLINNVINSNMDLKKELATLRSQLSPK